MADFDWSPTRRSRTKIKRSRFSEEQIIGILKELLAEAMLDNVVLKDLASKNGDAWRWWPTRCYRTCGSRGS